MFLIFIILFIIGELLSSLFIMGVVNFTCYVFSISFSLTFLQSLAVSLVITAVNGLIRRNK